MDIARRLEWLKRYTARGLHNDFTARRHNDTVGLLANADAETERWQAAWTAGDVVTADTFVGEATGLINTIQSAEETLLGIVDDVLASLRSGNEMVHQSTSSATL